MVHASILWFREWFFILRGAGEGVQVGQVGGEGGYSGEALDIAPFSRIQTQNHIGQGGTGGRLEVIYSFLAVVGWIEVGHYVLPAHVAEMSRKSSRCRRTS